MKQKTATNFDPRKFEALLRADFRPFLEKVFSTLSPGQSFIPTWHLEAIAYQLERVRRGEIKRLIINMPPRSLKSVTASVAFPAFILGHDPTRRIICVSVLRRSRQKARERLPRGRRGSLVSRALSRHADWAKGFRDRN